jgi:predicted RNase H-like HicB family nuclease
MKFVYPACFYREKDGRYSVEFADFQLATYGDDIADAMKMAADAAAGRILLLLKDGEAPPPPSDPKTLVPDDASGFVSMVYVDLDGRCPESDEATVSKTITIPMWLARAAEHRSVDFEETFEEALIERLVSG